MNQLRNGISSSPNKYNFTVIINAINRKDYLLRAVDSVLTQKNVIKPLEIIVVKNFQESSIDNYLTRKNVKVRNIDSKKQGVIMQEGFHESEGEILCYLDDDDYYLPGKLSRVVEVFENDMKVGFYHNSYKILDEKEMVHGDSLRRKLNSSFSKVVSSRKDLNFVLSRGGNVNMSSICIKRGVIKPYISKFNSIDAVNDDFLLYLAIEGNYKAFLDSNVLTVYSFHQSNSHSIQSYETFLKESVERLLKRVDGYKVIYKLVNKPYLKEASQCRFERDLSMVNILSKKSTPRILLRDLLSNLKCIKKNPSITNIAFLISLLISVVIGNFSLKILYIIRSKVVTV